ncbi:MAG: VIT domain-containing protein, partial [Methyloligellaceae bacterium]
MFLAVFALATLDKRAARSAPVLMAKAAAPAQTGTLSPASVTMGTLLLRAPGKDNPNALTQAQRLDTDADIVITGPVARASVTQRFRNTSGHRVEGLYAFPLPDMAAVNALSMKIGECIVKAKIIPRTEAHRMYQAAKTAGMKASLSSQHRSNVFISAVTAIGPGEEITIRIEYQQMLRRNGEAYSLRFPLVAAPRHTPGLPLHNVKLDGRAGVPGPNLPLRDPAGGRINRVSLQIRLDSGFPLGPVTSATHEIALRRTGDKTALLALSQAMVRADRDFELTWAPKGTAVPLIAAFQEELDASHYVLAMLAPPKVGAASISAPREVIFAIDTSGSMAGTAIEQAKQSLGLALKRLKPGD